VPAGVTLRPGTEADVPAIMHLFDLAIEWLVSKGITQQWGTEPWSTNPSRVERMTSLVVEPSKLWVAELASAEAKAENRVVGAMAAGAKNDYAPVLDEPELYLKLLITHRAYTGLRIGDVLVLKAKELAKQAGVPVLRVDCYAGSGGKLAQWYEKQGFVKTETFEVKGWPGQYLQMRMD
jgi:GNAT superfamily N-acetyltransferase